MNNITIAFDVITTEDIRINKLFPRLQRSSYSKATKAILSQGSGNTFFWRPYTCNKGTGETIVKYFADELRLKFNQYKCDGCLIPIIYG